VGTWKATSSEKVMNMIKRYCPSKEYNVGIGANNKMFIAPSTHEFEKNVEVLAENTPIDKILLYIKAGHFKTGEIFILAGEQFSTHIFEDNDLSEMMNEIAEENENLKKQISSIRVKFGEEEQNMQYLIEEIEKLRAENSSFEEELYSRDREAVVLNEKVEELTESLGNADLFLQGIFKKSGGDKSVLPSDLVERVAFLLDKIKENLSGEDEESN